MFSCFVNSQKKKTTTVEKIIEEPSKEVVNVEPTSSKKKYKYSAYKIKYFTIVKQFFDSNTCSTCHEDVFTDISIGPSLKMVAERYSDPENVPYDYLVEKIKKGYTNMPNTYKLNAPMAEMVPHSYISDSDIKDMIDYMIYRGSQ